MQVTPCVQDAGHHAASLLTRLNLQRQQGQFCDCVLRQKQNPDQIYPAHRCVLAASSPVLASILLSAGALVELQDPCLSDSALVFLLDYIYTSVLPCSLSQQQCYRLFSAARHLQMKELQEALRAAWRRMLAGENGNDLKTFSELSLSPKNKCFRRHEEAEALYSPDEATFEETQMTSVSFISSVKNKEKGTDENDSNHPSRTHVRTLNSPINFCELKSSGDESKVIAQQNLLQNNPVLTEVHNIPGVNEDMHEHQCHSGGFVKLKICPGSTEEELLETSKLRRRSSSSSSTSPRQCFGAVPVICHSSRAAVLPAPASTITITEHKYQDEEQNQDTRNKTNPPEMNDGSNSSPTDRSIPNSKLLVQGLTHNIDHDNQHDDCDSLQSDVSLVPQNKDKGSKRSMERDFDQFFSKHQHLDCSECPNESLTVATEGLTADWGSVVSLPEKVSDAGSDFHCEGGLAVETKQEHIFSIRLLAKANREDSNYKRHRSETNKYSNDFGAEKSRNGVVSIQHGYRSNSTSTSSESGLDDAFASEHCTSSESREISSSKISYLSPMTPTEHSMSDPTGQCFGQPYHGHLHYQYFPHQDTQSLIQDYNYKYSQHSYSYGLDDSTDEEEDASFVVKQKTNEVLLLDKNSKPTELPCKHKSDLEEKWVLKGNKELCVSRDEGGIETNEQRNDEIRNSSAILPAAQNRWSVCSTPSATDSEHTSMPSTLSSCVSSSLPASRQGERSAPNQQPFQCSLCDRAFSQRGSLNRHVRSHLGVRPFPCPCCPMTFSRQYRVTEHMRVHQRCSLGNGFQKQVDSSGRVNEERPQN